MGLNSCEKMDKNQTLLNWAEVQGKSSVLIGYQLARQGNSKMGASLYRLVRHRLGEEEGKAFQTVGLNELVI